ncbi:MAG: hypothetical protein ACRD88_00040 [Terriglobia bacterium]
MPRAIATTIARKAPGLTPAEIRFLRKCLGWSGADFAAHMGVSNAAATMGSAPAAQRLQVRVEKGRWNAEAA